MNGSIRSRLCLLVGITVIAVGLAGVGTAFGVTEPLSNTGTPAEFVVSEDNVTLTTGDSSEIVVDNLSNVDGITIEETETGQFTIQTTEDQPLTDSDRERARTIAVTNATVAQALDEMDTYQISVEPIQKLNTSTFNQASYDAVAEINNTDDDITIMETGDGESDGSVTINRETNYVDDRAVVRIRDPGDSRPQDLQYTVDINLANETVTEITDWKEIRQSSPTVNNSGKLGQTETTGRTS